ncbi:MAG: division/cell wall cluster transcriptional repressor MraZ [Clostridia bacterium]|nr:division/cell wall cluster transcriptional repressor MraZ [Clostridia bacterium]
MLIGHYNHTLDQKGRVSVPAKYRDEMGANFVVSKGYGNCVCGYPLDKWDAWRESVEKLPVSKSRVKRFFLGSAFEVEVDKQGRIILPADLREFAGLETEVVVAGMSDHIEIWSRDRWLDEERRDDEDIEELLGSIEI